MRGNIQYFHIALKFIFQLHKRNIHDEYYSSKFIIDVFMTFVEYK